MPPRRTNGRRVPVGGRPADQRPDARLSWPRQAVPQQRDGPWRSRTATIRTSPEPVVLAYVRINTPDIPENTTSIRDLLVTDVEVKTQIRSGRPLARLLALLRGVGVPVREGDLLLLSNDRLRRQVSQPVAYRPSMRTSMSFAGCPLSALGQVSEPVLRASIGDPVMIRRSDSPRPRSRASAVAACRWKKTTPNERRRRRRYRRSRRARLLCSTRAEYRPVHAGEPGRRSDHRPDGQRRHPAQARRSQPGRRDSPGSARRSDDATAERLRGKSVVHHARQQDLTAG